MTRAIHEGQMKNDQFRALTTPIYQTSTYRFENTQQGIDIFKGEEPGFVYTRNGNPTIRTLENKVVALEGGAGAVACASGMGAIASLCWTHLQSGDHIIVGDCLYGCSDLLIRQSMPKFDIEVSAVDTSNIDAVREAIRPNTKIIFFETPTNPLMKLTDISAVSDVARAANEDILVVVDNTFAPPPIQRPLDCGADMVVHSATKYLNGHGDVIGGLIVSKDEKYLPDLRRLGMTKLTGSVMSPFDAYLVIRGIQTLGLRIERHCENALKVARYLQTKGEVARVYYPGLDETGSTNATEGSANPQGANDGNASPQSASDCATQQEILKTQMHGLGTGILSFELQPEIRGKSGEEAAKIVLDNMQVVHLAVSLGDPFSLIEYPFRMTHIVVPDEVKLASGITPELIRFSAGLEDAEDLIADFEQAFARI